MQNLMAVQAEGTRGSRAVRVGVCVSLGAAAVLVAGMVQVRPALAGERKLPQAVAAADDNGPRLLGGEHAQQQLRQARRELATAEQNATTEEDRRRIATAREVAAAAEHVIAAAGSTRQASPGELPDLGTLNIDLSRLKVDTEALQHLNLNAKELQTHLQAQQKAMQQLQDRLNSPEWKENIRRQQQDAMAKAAAVMNSPEFRANMEAASRIDTAKMNAMLADARQQQERALEQLRSGAFQRQMADAARFTARVEMPALPAFPPALPAAPNTSSSAAEPLKVPSNVMASNNLTKKTPIYPPEAKEKKMQGEVVLHAIISEQGKVEQLQVVSSPDEMFSKSALDAVREWVYKPYLLNGDPRAVDTTITVHYSLVP